MATSWKFYEQQLARYNKHKDENPLEALMAITHMWNFLLDNLGKSDVAANDAYLEEAVKKLLSIIEYYKSTENPLVQDLACSLTQDPQALTNNADLAATISNLDSLLLLEYMQLRYPLALGSSKLIQEYQTKIAYYIAMREHNPKQAIIALSDIYSFLGRFDNDFSDDCIQHRLLHLEALCLAVEHYKTSSDPFVRSFASKLLADIDGKPEHTLSSPQPAAIKTPPVPNSSPTSPATPATMRSCFFAIPRNNGSKVENDIDSNHGSANSSPIFHVSGEDTLAQAITNIQKCFMSDQHQKLQHYTQHENYLARAVAHLYTRDNRGFQIDEAHEILSNFTTIADTDAKLLLDVIASRMDSSLKAHLQVPTPSCKNINALVREKRSIEEPSQYQEPTTNRQLAF